MRSEINGILCGGTGREDPASDALADENINDECRVKKPMNS